MATAVIKACCVCGLDVSRMRRTRDPRGNYYCQPCYQTLWEAHQRRLAERAAIVEADPTAAALLMERAVEAASAASAARSDTAPEPMVNAVRSEVGSGEGRSAEFRITAMPASNDDVEPLQRCSSLGRAISRAASALAALRAAPQAIGGAAEPVVSVTARRVKRQRPRGALRLSDLIGEEAQSAVESARDHRFHEPEIPVSPITNPPVSALVDDYAALVEPREPVFAMPNPSLA